MLLPLSGQASGVQTQPIDVAASVNRVCATQSTTPPLIEYDPLNVNATTDVKMLLGTLTVTCNSAVTTVFNADHGLHGTPSGAYYQNRMYQRDFQTYLNYSIYTDNTYAHVFGTTSTDSSGVGGITESFVMTSGTPQSVNVYIDIPAGQNQPVGTYQDQIDFTVTY